MIKSVKSDVGYFRVDSVFDRESNQVESRPGTKILPSSIFSTSEDLLCLNKSTSKEKILLMQSDFSVFRYIHSQRCRQSTKLQLIQQNVCNKSTFSENVRTCLTERGVGWYSKWTGLLHCSHLQRLHKCKQILCAQSHVNSTVSRHCCGLFGGSNWRSTQRLVHNDRTPDSWAKQRLSLSVIQSPMTHITTCTQWSTHTTIMINV